MVSRQVYGVEGRQEAGRQGGQEKTWAEAAGEFIGTQKRFSDLLLTRGVEKWRNTAGLRGFRGLGLKYPHTPAYTPYGDN